MTLRCPDCKTVFETHEALGMTANPNYYWVNCPNCKHSDLLEYGSKNTRSYEKID